MHVLCGAQSCPTPCDPMDCVACQVPQSMEFSRQEYWSRLPFSSPGDLSDPGIESRLPTLQTDSLPSELPGKPKNTGVGSLVLLQGIFLTQELNQGLLHCRRIFYQLSYQESPIISLSEVSSVKIVNSYMHTWKWYNTVNLLLLLSRFSRVRLYVTPWTILSMDFPGQNTGVDNLSLL